MKFYTWLLRELCYNKQILSSFHTHYSWIPLYYQQKASFNRCVNPPSSPPKYNIYKKKVPFIECWFYPWLYPCIYLNILFKHKLFTFYIYLLKMFILIWIFLEILVIVKQQQQQKKVLFLFYNMYFHCKHFVFYFA